jgi:predicted metal-dependent hydrolase
VAKKPKNSVNKMSVRVDQIIRSKRKTLAVIVRADGSVIVRAPVRAPEKTIREFIENHTEWIQKKQAEVLTFRPPEPKQYRPGELFMYLGNAYPLEVVTGQKKPLLLEQSFQLAESAESRAKLAFERWYRVQAREILTERVNHYASQYGFPYKKIGITSARTRWGSCSANGSLNFSWRLILAPLEAVDYVVVHELVHTVHHNHGRRFWKKVETIMPDYKERRKWLRKNGPQLIL